MITLDRYRKCMRAIFDTLLSSDDGMTVYEIAKMTGYPRSTVGIVIEDNPLFYIDRWKDGVTAVYMVNHFIEDCPKP